MTRFVYVLWTRINCEKPFFFDADFAQFHADFCEMIDDFWYIYKSFLLPDLKRLVQDNVNLFEKMADILQYEPKFFAFNDIQKWLFEVFETGEMPRAGVFASCLNWQAEDVASLASLYVKDSQMRSWIVKNWNSCRQYRYSIVWALRKDHIFDAELFRKYNPHFLRQFSLFVLLLGSVSWLHFNEYIPLGMFYLAMVLLGYWILLELVFTLFCHKYKAFW